MGRKNANSKNLKINGFKFFQAHLENLRSEINTHEEQGFTKPLSSSAIAMYLGITSECSQSGVLDLGTSIASISRKLDIAPQTGHDGLRELVSRGLILQRTYKGKTQYEVGGYDFYNRSSEESMGKTKGVNYFLVPNHVFESGIIPKLVRANSNRGLMLLLELSNSFHRDLNIWGKEGTVRKMDYFRDMLDERSSKRVRKVLEILSPVFTFNPIDLQERKPRNLADRVRKAVTQLWIKKYDVRITPACLMEKTEMETDVTQALKETEMQLKYMGFPLQAKERRGIHIIYRAYVREVAQYVSDFNIRKDLILGSVKSTMMKLDEVRMEGAIDSVGGFINKHLKSFVMHFIKNNPGVYSDVVSACETTGAKLPRLIDEYITQNAS